MSVPTPTKLVMTLGGFIRVFLGLYTIWLAYTAIHWGLAAAGWDLLLALIAVVVTLIHVLLQDRVRYGDYLFMGLFLIFAVVVMVWMT